MTGKILLPLLLLATLGTGCSSPEASQDVLLNYYYWQARGGIDDVTSSYLEQSGSDKLYMRFFDVHYIEEQYQKGSFPVSISQATVGQLPTGIEVVPVVYIENDVFSKSSDDDLEDLVQNVVMKIQSLLDTKGLEALNEIQIDCDWTESTRDRYFNFLSTLKKEEGAMLSATIRLHQVKYYETTGIPPVSYGVLMFYNMGAVTSRYESNSILNLEEAEKYLQGADEYPLRLVTAFPTFSWGVLFRKNKAIALLNNTDLSLFESALFQKQEDGSYRCLERCFIDGKWLYEDDLVRFEAVSAELLERAQKMVVTHLGPQESYIIYHLNDDLVTRMTTQELKDIFQ